MVVGRCALCQREEELQESHLLPRAIYRDLRTPGLPNPNPILGTPEETGPRQEQIKADLLCAACEERFNRSGEHWVLANGFRLKGPSRVFELLRAATPLPEHRGGTVYAGDKIADLDMDRLAYFGISVFWRASLPVWPTRRKPSALIELGSYRESLRRYLLGEVDLPGDVVLMTAVSRSPCPPPVMAFPSGERKGGYHQHIFEIPGQSFMLLVGRQVPKKYRSLCAVRNKIIFFTPIERITARNTAQLFRKSPSSPALRKLHRKVSEEDGVRSFIEELRTEH